MSTGTLSERLAALAGRDECSRGDLVSAHVGELGQPIPAQYKKRTRS